MPITPARPVRRQTQSEFKEIAFDVMRHVFNIHNEFGRFFAEAIYKQELFNRMPNVELEFPSQVSHDNYSRMYFVDALVSGGVFEFKAVDALTPRDRAQLYNYLLLLDLGHGKLVNMRLESVAHEFVNAMVRTSDRHAFTISKECWNPSISGANLLQETLVALLRDWGVGLNLEMYESALIHFLGGEDKVLRQVDVRQEQYRLGSQFLHFASDNVAYRITAFRHADNQFKNHAYRLLRHVDLRALLWINIGMDQVTFTTLEKKSPHF